VVRLAADVLAALPKGSRSRSCLVLAALRGESVELASIGDSNAFVAGAANGLASENSLLIGKEPLAGVRAELFHLRFTRADGERIALVSDGITNFIPDRSLIPRLLAESPSDLAAARAIAEAALDGGAGDNVAVAAFAGRAGV